MARDDAGDRLVAFVRALDVDRDHVAHPEPLATRRVVELDQRRLHVEQVARLPRPREVLDLLAGDSPGPDLLERLMLVGRSALVEVEDPAPRRSVLVVAVASRHHDSQVGQVEAAGFAVDDLPAERALADAVRRASARHAVDASTWTGGVAVARLEVRARDAPGHAAWSAITRSVRSSR
jgi:hypothetical protein